MKLLNHNLEFKKEKKKKDKAAKCAWLTQPGLTQSHHFISHFLHLARRVAPDLVDLVLRNFKG